MNLIRRYAGQLPILGVCLGHQCIGKAFGGNIIPADRLMHGKTSLIHHDRRSVFRGLPTPIDATRYHSLVLDRETLPDGLEITARTDRKELMGIRHVELPVEGVQFHPESIMTEQGYQMIHTFCQQCHVEQNRRAAQKKTASSFPDQD